MCICKDIFYREILERHLSVPLDNLSTYLEYYLVDPIYIVKLYLFSIYKCTKYIFTFEFALQEMYLWQLQGDGRLKNKHYGHKWKYGDKKWTILNPEAEFSHIKEETGQVLGINSTAREK